MAKFAKLFELENGEQVLVIKNYNVLKDKYEITYRTDIGGCTFETTFSHFSLKEANKVLETYTEKQALMFRTELIKMIEE
ncbi:MAG TPA: hypothetical protein PK431_10860 [Chitinophagales bacterium]|nr:hypothetical protein [Chitinophagales bacterium]